MNKKIIFLVILLILLMNPINAHYDVRNIEITNKEFKEISNTQNEITYYLKIPLKYSISYCDSNLNTVK